MRVNLVPIPGTLNYARRVGYTWAASSTPYGCGLNRQPTEQGRRRGGEREALVFDGW
jgi:hypothetical protein